MSLSNGVRSERFTTDDLDELLFRIFQSVTHDLAFAYELAHRMETQDCRRLGFRRQVELLSAISPSWAERKGREHDRILKEHPFGDMAGRELRDAGHSPQTASQIASQRDPLPVAQNKFSSNERALQANDLRHRRRSIIILIIVCGLQGLLLLPWPIASFMAIFFFDAPIRGSGDEISRYLAAFSIWFYPVFYGIALLISLLAFRK